MRLPFSGWTRHILGITLGLVLTASAADAEPLRFADVQAFWTRDGLHTVDLFAIPGPVLVGSEIEIDGVRRAAISFGVPIFGTLEPGEFDTLRMTFGMPGWDDPFSNTVQELTFFAGPNFPNGIIGGMDYPILYRPEIFTLTIDLLRSSPDFRIPSGPRAGELVDSYTYTFSVVQPVPEPASMILVGSGIGALVMARRRRRQRH